jgi:hypothetical protein
MGDMLLGDRVELNVFLMPDTPINWSQQFLKLAL